MDRWMIRNAAKVTADWSSLSEDTIQSFARAMNEAPAQDGQTG